MEVVVRMYGDSPSWNDCIADLLFRLEESQIRRERLPSSETDDANPSMGPARFPFYYVGAVDGDF